MYCFGVDALKRKGLHLLMSSTQCFKFFKDFDLHSSLSILSQLRFVDSANKSCNSTRIDANVPKNT